MKLDAQSPDYARRAKLWELPNDLMGGTRCMRSRREKWLPKEPREEEEDYNIRLNRAYLFPAYSDTIDRVSGQPFVRPVTLKGAVPEALTPIEKDADREGTTLSRFARRVLRDGLHRTVTYILVDAPSFDPKTPADQEKPLNLRPYFAHIKAEDLFYCEETRGVDGSNELAEIRYYFCEETTDKDGNQVETRFIRKLTKTAWETFSQNEKKEWVSVDKGVNGFGAIALVELEFTEDDDCCRGSCFDDLAWMNVQHWQASADQSVLMRTARFPMVFFKNPGGGCDAVNTPKKPVVLGPGRVFRTEDKDADMKFVEHSGAAAAAGRSEIQDIEKKMEMLGNRPFLERTGNATATAAAIDESRDQTDIQAWITILEHGLEAAYDYAAEFASVTLPDDFSVDVYSEFTLSLRAESDGRLLLDARRAGEITRVSFLRELRKRGVLSSDVDPETEAAAAAEENPPMPPPLPFGANSFGSNQTAPPKAG